MPFVAVDIGNTRLKLGLFSGAEVASGIPLPEPASTLNVTVDRLDEILPWLEPHCVADVSWHIGSVQRAFTTELLDWLRRGDRLPASPKNENAALATAGWKPTSQIALLCS